MSFLIIRKELLLGPFEIIIVLVIKLHMKSKLITGRFRYFKVGQSSLQSTIPISYQH